MLLPALPMSRLRDLPQILQVGNTETEVEVEEGEGSLVFKGVRWGK